MLLPPVELYLALIQEVKSLLQGETDLSRGNLRMRGGLVTLTPPCELIVVGDLHGDLSSLARIIDASRFYDKVREREGVFLIFLGDYGDRGEGTPEVYFKVLSLKKQHPGNVITLRGNHEAPKDLLAYPHDTPFFYKMKYGEDGMRIYNALVELFDLLHHAVLVEGYCFMAHGGVAYNLTSKLELERARELHPASDLLEQLLWNDPVDGVPWTAPSPRGAGFLFGKGVTEKVLRSLGVKFLVRSHEPCEGVDVRHGGLTTTVFSRRGFPYQNLRIAFLDIELTKDSALKLPPHRYAVLL